MLAKLIGSSYTLSKHGHREAPSSHRHVTDSFPGACPKGSSYLQTQEIDAESLTQTHFFWGIVRKWNTKACRPAKRPPAPNRRKDLWMNYFRFITANSDGWLYRS